MVADRILYSDVFWVGVILWLACFVCCVVTAPAGESLNGSLISSHLFKLSYIYISDIKIAGSNVSYIASRINKKWEYEKHSTGTPVDEPAETKNTNTNEDRNSKGWTHQKSTVGDSKEVLTWKMVKTFIFQSHMERWKSLEEIRFWQGQPRPRRRTRKSSWWIRRVFTTFSRLIAGFVKQEMISDPFQRTTFTVITLNRESNCTLRDESFPIPRRWCRRWPRLVRRVDTCPKFTIRMKNIQMGVHGSGKRSQRKQKWAIEKPKLDNARKLWGMHFVDPADEDFKETMKKLHGESWKDLWQQSCFARSGEESAGRLEALLIFARRNTHASLKPTNLRESV